MALKIRTGNSSQTNSSVVINNPLLLRLLFCFCLGGGVGQGEGGRGVPGAHRERRNPFICIFPNFIREHLPSRDGSNVLPSARPLIPCINHFFRLLCVPGPKKKKKTHNQRSCHFLLWLVMLVFTSRFETPVVQTPILGSKGPPY